MIPIVLVTLAYILGICGGLYVKCIALFCFILYALFRKKEKRIIILTVAFFLLGTTITYMRKNAYDEKYLPGKISMQAKVISDVIEKERVNSYIIKNGKGDKFLIYLDKNILLEYGSQIMVEGNFMKADIARNRGGFNYRRYLNSQNIYGSIYSTKVDVVELPKREWIYSLKKDIEKSFLKYLPKEQVGIIEGMIIGDTSYLPEEIKNDFRTCGISHLLAVSGANVAYILILCKFLFEKLLGRNISNGVTIFCIILFMLLSGASASVIRATMMTVFIILAEFFSQKPNTYASIASSALLILLYNPFIIYDVGFVLSFGGTIGIVLFSSKIQEFIKSKIPCLDEDKPTLWRKVLLVIIETLSVSLAAQIILNPIILYYFNTFSVISIFVNVLIVPITGIVTILGIFLYMASLIYFPIAKIISYVLYSCISFMINISHFFSDLPFSNILLPTPSIIAITIYYILVLCIFFKKKKWVNRIICITISILMIRTIFPANKIEVNMVDVGQGDCTYVKSNRGSIILIDGGGSENSMYDVGENILVPYLLDRGNLIVDCIFISHIHEDHVEGILTVLEKLIVKRVIIGEQNTTSELYENMIAMINKKNIPLSIVKKGDKIKIDDIIFEIIEADKEQKNINNTSLIIKMIYGKTSILFTGDAEKELEEKLTSPITSNILKVPHHGSATSSTKEFLQKVSPQIAFIGVGEKNHFGHPNQEVLERLQKEGVIIYRTDLCGEIYMDIKKKGKIKIKTMLD